MFRPTLREWLREGPFSLAMSSGFFGFFAHAGLLTVIEDEGLTPIRVTGSSAGALAGGVWAAGLPATALRDELCRLERADFWDPSIGLGLLRGRLFRERLEALLPTPSFEGCSTPLAVTAYDVLSRSSRVLDRGALAPAIQASCTVPFLFQPLWHEGRPLLDGGIADRPGLLGMPEGARVLYHHLASRSPWRGLDSVGIEAPRRAGLLALVIERLPRVGPFRLPEGARAFEIARRAVREAMGHAVDGDVVSVAGEA